MFSQLHHIYKFGQDGFTFGVIVDRDKVRHRWWSFP